MSDVNTDWLVDSVGAYDGIGQVAGQPHGYITGPVIVRNLSISFSGSVQATDWLAASVQPSDSLI